MSEVLSALVNGVIVSALITAGVSLVMLVCRRSWNAATRYAAWWAVLLAAVAMSLPHKYDVSDSLPLSLDASPEIRDVRLIQGTTAKHQEKAAVGRSDATFLAAPPAAAPSRHMRFPIQVPSGRWTSWLLATWMLASALMLVRLIISYVFLHRRKVRATAVSAHDALLREWLAHCGAGKRSVRLAVSPEITTPIAVGPHRPAILIPTCMMNELDEGQLNQIGLHEAAHLARRDDYAVIFQRILEALFVFHPVVRWIARRIDLEREIACDDFVLQATGKGRPYATCLTRIVELAGGAWHSRLAASATETRSHLETRVDMLLDSTRKTTTRLLKPQILAAIVVLAVMISIAAQAPRLVLFAMPPVAAARPAQPAAAPAAEAAAEPRHSEPLRQPPMMQQAPPPARPPETLPAKDTLVQVPVVVTDSLGRFVSGLEKEHFTIVEDKVEQEISQFSGVGALSIALVYDVRDSAIGRELLSQGLVQFTNDDLSLVYGLDTKPQWSDGSRRSAFYLLFGVAAGQSGPAALLDGVQMAIEHMKSSRNPRKGILILSDGNEPSTPYTESQIRAIANEADAQIFAVSLAQPGALPGRALRW